MKLMSSSVDFIQHLSGEDLLMKNVLPTLQNLEMIL